MGDRLVRAMRTLSLSLSLSLSSGRIGSGRSVPAGPSQSRAVKRPAALRGPCRAEGTWSVSMCQMASASLRAISTRDRGPALPAEPLREQEPPGGGAQVSRRVAIPRAGSTSIGRYGSTRWPAGGETRLSKRHDKVAVGRRASDRSVREESCNRVVKQAPSNRGAIQEPSPECMGEGHGRCEELGRAAPMDPSAYWQRNDHTAHRGTGEIRLDAGCRGPGCRPGCSGSGEAMSVPREVVERRAEAGGGHSSQDRGGQHNPPERRPSII